MKTKTEEYDLLSFFDRHLNASLKAVVRNCLSIRNNVVGNSKSIITIIAVSAKIKRGTCFPYPRQKTNLTVGVQNVDLADYFVRDILFTGKNPH